MFLYLGIIQLVTMNWSEHSTTHSNLPINPIRGVGCIYDHPIYTFNKKKLRCIWVFIFQLAWFNQRGGGALPLSSLFGGMTLSVCWTFHHDQSGIIITSPKLIYFHECVLTCQVFPSDEKYFVLCCSASVPSCRQCRFVQSFMCYQASHGEIFQNNQFLGGKMFWSLHATF